MEWFSSRLEIKERGGLDRENNMFCIQARSQLPHCVQLVCKVHHSIGLHLVVQVHTHIQEEHKQDCYSFTATVSNTHSFLLSLHNVHVCLYIKYMNNVSTVHRVSIVGIYLGYSSVTHAVI